MRLWRIGALCCMIVGVVIGCSRARPIREIQKSPLDYREKIVSVRGAVRETIQIPFTNRCLYRLEDETGAIWVLGAGPVPREKERKTARGTVQTGITIGTRTFGVLLKEEPAP